MAVAEIGGVQTSPKTGGISMHSQGNIFPRRRVAKNPPKREVASVITTKRKVVPDSGSLIISLPVSSYKPSANKAKVPGSGTADGAGVWVEV